MKKKSLMIVSFLLLVICTGCNNYSTKQVIKKVKNYFKDSFNIEVVSIDSVTKTDKYITMSANGNEFEVHSIYNDNAAGGFGDTEIQTNILSKFLIKYKSKIKSIANDNNLNIQFDNSDEIVFNISADIDQIENVHKFATEVLKIDEINKLFNLAYDYDENGDEISYSFYDLDMIGSNCTRITIYDNSYKMDSFTIFEEIFENRTGKILQQYN